MPHPNAALIASFFTALSHLDGETLAASYAPDAIFVDPVFEELRGAQVGDMWRMLTARAVKFSLIFDGVEADEHRGAARWVATYTFARTGRVVVNRVQSRFTFRDGKIVRQVDQFDVWAWARQALGFKGWLLGWSKFLQTRIRAQAAAGLAAFRQRS